MKNLATTIAVALAAIGYGISIAIIDLITYLIYDLQVNGFCWSRCPEPNIYEKIYLASSIFLLIVVTIFMHFKIKDMQGEKKQVFVRIGIFFAIIFAVIFSKILFNYI